MEKQLSKLMTKAIRVNVSDEFNVWFELHGHVNSVTLRISNRNYQDEFFNDMFYYQGDMYKEKIAKGKIEYWETQLNLLIKKCQA